MIKELIDKSLEEIITLKGPSLVVAFIIMLGYCLKMIPRFPNKFIPLISFVVGPLLTPLMVKWPEVGDMPPVRWPEISAWAQVLCMGLLLACVAWIMHAQVLRRIIDDKVPALNPGRETSTVTEESTLETAAGTEKVATEKTVVTETKPPPTDPDPTLTKPQGQP